MDGKYLRGEIYFAHLGTGIGSEQRGRRPVIIIQNDIGNKYSPTVIVAAITSEVKHKGNLPVHHMIGPVDGLKKDSYILLEQIRTIDKKRLDRYIGKIPEKHIIDIDNALAISIGLNVNAEKKHLWLCDTCAKRLKGISAFSFVKDSNFVYKTKKCSFCNHRKGTFYKASLKNKEDKEDAVIDGRTSV